MIFWGVKNLNNRSKDEPCQVFFEKKADALAFMRERQLTEDKHLRKVDLKDRKDAVEFCNEMCEFPAKHPEYFCN